MCLITRACSRRLLVERSLNRGMRGESELPQEIEPGVTVADFGCPYSFYLIQTRVFQRLSYKWHMETLPSAHSLYCL